MEFRLLGRLQVDAEGRDLTPRRPRERALLAVLLLRYPRVVGVDELIDALWGEEPPPTARTALHGLVSSLRRVLGAERLATDSPGYRLVLLPDDRYDVARLESLVEDAASTTPAVRAEMLREARDLFRGEPFGDIDLAIDVHAEVARLEALRLAAEEGHVAAELDLGRHAEVLPRLERLVAEHPLREGPRSQLMLALYRAGRQADALRVAQETRTILATDLGVEPGPALQRLERQVLEQDPALLGPGAGHVRPAGELLRGGLATILAVGPAAGEGLGAEAVRDLATAHGAADVPARRGAAFAFARAREAAAAAAAIQRAARRTGVAVRIGLHSGATGVISTRLPARLPMADQATRLADLAHPGQVVLSRATRDLLRETPLHEVDVRDLGVHRLSDLGPSQPLYQLVAPGLEVGFASTRGLDDMPTNLPIQTTPFIDREVELDAVTGLLRDPGVRLVTLTGPGGTGKTRLAVHAAAEVVDEASGGTWFVPLEALADAALVSSAIVTALGVIGEGPSAVGAIARDLAGRPTLLVLDNFEQVIDAAGFVGDLLEATVEVTVLVTSRVPLKLPLERVVPVPPLPVPTEEDTTTTDPDVSTLLGVGSVALFWAIATAVRPGLAMTSQDAGAVAELCRALDGLPLAIELAASRVGLMSPGSVLQRLDRPLRLLTARGRPGAERHRALEATIDWSHELLEPDLRRLFADLAVFSGGWTLDAAEAVCDDDLDVVDGLARLVDHSLVRLGGSDADPRFGMLATIRDYAAAKLDASGRRAEVERRHASFFLSLAEDAEQHLRGNPGPWLAGLEIEQDNLRAALDRLARASEVAPEAVSDAASDHTPVEGRHAALTEARLAGALWQFWYLAGHLAEGGARLEHARVVHRDPTPTRIKVLIGVAVMAQNAVDVDVAARWAAEALELSHSIGDPWSAAYAQFMLGNVASTRADEEAARTLYEDSVQAFRVLGDEHSALLAARGLANTLLGVGELDAARALYQDNLRRARTDGNGRLEASTLGALAMIAFDEGRVTDATLLLRESLRLHRQLGDRLDTAVDLGRAARTLAIGGRPVESAQLLGVISAIRDELGGRGRIVGEMADTTRAGLSRQLPAAELDRRIAEGARMRIEAAVELALRALD